MAKERETAEKQKRVPLSKKILREIFSWMWVILAFLFIHGTLVQARVIPSGSMERTLLVGDHLLVSRFGYDAQVPFTGLHMKLWRDPERGQMVVFRSVHPGSPDLVKRVIGLPGDRLEIRRGLVWIDGKPLVEPYRFGAPNPHENLGPLTVPAGHCFVMGDNRDNSYDSRHWGPVPRENIIGTPVVIYMSVEAPEQAWRPGQLQERLLAYVNAVIHPQLVRWKRLFVTF